MSDPTSDDDRIPLDRWVVPLNETANPPAAPPPPASADDPVPDTLHFPLDADVPGEGFQPRLRRFDKAG